MGAHDPYGHKQTNTKIQCDILSVLRTRVVFRKQQAQYKSCPKDELIAPSLPLESDVDAVFKLRPLLLAGLIPPSSVVDKRDQKYIHMHGQLSVEGMSGLRLASLLKVLVMTLNESQQARR